MPTNPPRSTSPKVERADKDRQSLFSQAGYPSSDVKPTAPLSPIFKDKPPGPFSSTPMVVYPPSPVFDSSEEDLPGVLANPDMPFNSVVDPDAPRIAHSTFAKPSSPVPSSPMPPTRTHRPSTAHSTSSEQTRDAVLEMMSMFTTTTTPRKRYTAGQIAQWRAEEEYYKGQIQEERGGKEICLIRYEPRQGWLGFWNKDNVLDIIDDLRELRSPKS